MPLMRCELRNHEADHLVLLPIHQPDGSSITTACLEHARESGAFCNTHEEPHLGFMDGTHACVRCIEDEVAQSTYLASSFAKVIRDRLSRDDLIELTEWSSVSSETNGSTEDVCILRAVITTAHRLGITDQEVIQEIIDRKTVEVILPPLG